MTTITTTKKIGTTVGRFGALDCRAGAGSVLYPGNL